VNDGAACRGSVDELVEQAAHAESVDETFAALVTALRGRGMEHVSFSLVTDHTALRQSQRFALLSTCPSEWVERYRASGLARLDPTWRRLYDADHAFEHRPSLYTATAAERAALAAWNELGVHGGVAVPLRGSGGALAAILATGRRERASSLGELSALNLLGLQFYTRYVQLCAAPAPAGVVLSDAERQVLTWSARGKTKKEIAIVLGTSPHTVDYHQRKLLKKLAVSSVAAAVARAISLRLLLQ
jgi:DNA-binding CsgD family transcriptional regulator